MRLGRFGIWGVHKDILTNQRAPFNLLTNDQSGRRRGRRDRGCWRSGMLWPPSPGEAMTTLGKNIKICKFLTDLELLDIDQSSHKISYNIRSFLESWQTLVLWENRCRKRRLSFREFNCKSWSKPSYWSKFWLSNSWWMWRHSLVLSGQTSWRPRARGAGCWGRPWRCPSPSTWRRSPTTSWRGRWVHRSVNTFRPL